MKYHIPKGLFDIVPKPLKDDAHWRESLRWQHLEKVMRSLSHEYGFSEIRTPIFEMTDLFTRNVGETSDIISKEMYTFCDKGNRSLSLRPEGTAPVMRAFIDNHLDQDSLFQKLFYIGPYFRYDRPQAGRYRQFYQFGVEAIGVSSPYQDLEIIDMLYELFSRLGLKNLKVMLNTLGEKECRPPYIAALKNYLLPFANDLTPDSKNRLEQNPLRILDTKDPKERKILENAPTILDYLDQDSKRDFSILTANLKKLNIPFEITPTLVRGLDYYNKTVFEITSDVLGAQNTIGAGGRYDGLLNEMGGPDLPAIGYAVGIERLLQTMEGQKIAFPEKPKPFLYLIPLDERAKEELLPLLLQLRHKNVPCELFWRGKKIQNALQIANTLGAPYTLVLGENERTKSVAQLKNMNARTTEEVSLESLFETIMNKWENNV